MQVTVLRAFVRKPGTSRVVTGSVVPGKTTATRFGTMTSLPSTKLNAVTTPPGVKKASTVWPPQSRTRRFSQEGGGAAAPAVVAVPSTVAIARGAARRAQPRLKAHPTPRTLDDVEIATLEWVDWFNNRRLHTELGDIPPAEHEATYYRQITASTTLETREPSLH